MTCVFCLLIESYDEKPSTAPAIIGQWPDAVVVVPINPVTAGHLLVVPRRHVATATDAPEVAGLTMLRAAEMGAEEESLNFIINEGESATQTVPHLHIHVVPRRAGDGLPLPWTARQTPEQSLLAAMNEA